MYSYKSSEHLLCLIPIMSFFLPKMVDNAENGKHSALTKLNNFEKKIFEIFSIQIMETVNFFLFCFITHFSWLNKYEYEFCEVVFFA